MVFSNQKVVKKLRLFFFITGACSLLTMVVLLVAGMFTAMVILAVLFLIVVLTIALLNFQYVRIAEERNRLNVRYYSIFAMEKNFETFDFHLAQLRNVMIDRHFLGLKWDIRFTIRVKKGLADYPPVSLSAVPFRERSILVRELRKLIPQK
jgi:hypothetical protein